MNAPEGGRLTLRLVSSSEREVLYQGELSASVGAWTVRCAVAQADGAVSTEVQAERGAAPAWLVDLARVTLRAAWRSARSGTAWPRRLSRWREAPESAGTP